MPPNRRKESKAANLNVTPSSSTLDGKTTSISWPAIHAPYKPVPEITTILPSQILTLNLFSSSVTQQFLDFCQSHIVPVLTTTPIKPKKGDAVRFNDRFQVLDPSFADTLWKNSGLKEAVDGYEEEGKKSQEIWGGEPVGLNPNIRVYRYLKGQFF